MLTPGLRNGLRRLPTPRGIVFDMDGTLCEPQSWMFSRMRQALGIDNSIDILDHIESLPPSDQVVADNAIKAVEREAMVQMVAQPGLTRLMNYLRESGIRTAICTRNFDGPVQHLIESFLKGSEMFPVVTRAFKPPKPHPAGILHISQAWDIPTSEMVMVGDSIDDVVAGRKAGATTVLLLDKAGGNAHLVKHDCTDLVIHNLEELISLIEEGKQP